MAYNETTSDQPLTGFLQGYQQGDQASRQRALDASNQEAQQRQQDLAEQQSESQADQAKADADRDQSNKDRQYELSKLALTTKNDINLQKLEDARQRNKAALGDKSATRIYNETKFLGSQGMPYEMAHATAEGNEALRLHGQPVNPNISLYEKIDPDETAITGNVQPSGDTQENVGIPIPTATGIPTAQPAQPNPAQPASANPGLAMLLSAAGSPPSTQGPTNTAAAMLPQQAPVQSAPGAQVPTQPVGGAQTPTAGGTGVLPLVASKMAVQQATAAQKQQQTALAKERTDTEKALRDPKIANLTSLVTDRNAATAEKQRHDKMIETLGSQAQALRAQLGQGRLDVAQQNANTQAAKAGGGTGGGTGVVSANQQVGTVMRQRAQANTNWRQAAAERDKMIAEADKLNAAMSRPMPNPTAYPGGANDPGYQNAMANWSKIQAYAPIRLRTLVGDGQNDGGRISELNQQLEDLNGSIAQADQFLKARVTPTTPGGAPIPKGAPTFNSGSAPARTASPPRPSTPKPVQPVPSAPSDVNNFLNIIGAGKPTATTSTSPKGNPNQPATVTPPPGLKPAPATQKPATTKPAATGKPAQAKPKEYNFVNGKLVPVNP